MTERSRLAFLGGLRCVRMGHLLIATTILLEVVRKLFFTDSHPFPAGAFIATFGICGAMLSLVGVAHWCTVEDHRSSWAWLTLIGSIFSVIIYFADWASRMFKSGAGTVPQLVGITGEVGMLVCQIVILIILRSLAIEFFKGKLRAWSEQGIAFCSVTTLCLLPLAIFAPVVPELQQIGRGIAVFTATVAVAFVIAVSHQMIPHLKKKPMLEI